VCVEASVDGCNQAHAKAIVHTTRHKADRLVTGALELLFLAILADLVTVLWCCLAELCLGADHQSNCRM